jgi:hypothetical protein
MPSRTTHYNLLKPAEDEYYSINDFNQNADALDSALKNSTDTINAHTARTNNPHGVTAAQAGAEPARSLMTQNEATEGTGATVRGWTALRVRQAADAAINAASAQNPNELGYVPDTPWIELERTFRHIVYYRGMNNMVHVNVRVNMLGPGTYNIAAPMPEGFRPRVIAGYTNSISFGTHYASNGNHWSISTAGVITCNNGHGTGFSYAVLS